MPSVLIPLAIPPISLSATYFHPQFMEFAHFGDLYHFLRDTSRNLTWAKRLQLFLDASLGVRALHEHHPRSIIHSDLKSSNFLAVDAGDGHVVLKITDFGLASTVKSSSSSHMSSRTGVGTSNYKAPEVYEEHYQPIPASDIWSLGMVFYEIVTGKVPYDGLTELQVMKKVDAKELPNMDLIPADALKGLTVLIEYVCNFEPDGRPSIQEVVAQVQALRQMQLEADDAQQSHAVPPPPPRSTSHFEELKQMMLDLRMQHNADMDAMRRVMQAEGSKIRAGIEENAVDAGAERDRIIRIIQAEGNKIRDASEENAADASTERDRIIRIIQAEGNTIRDANEENAADASAERDRIIRIIQAKEPKS